MFFPLKMRQKYTFRIINLQDDFYNQQMLDFT
jgi:hypothetical protein